MEFKVGDRVFRDGRCGWKVLWIDTNDSDTKYFIVNGDMYWWARESELSLVRPTKPRPTRKSLKRRIAELEGHSESLATTCRERQEAIDKLKQQLTELSERLTTYAQKVLENKEAVKIVAALEKMELRWELYRKNDETWCIYKTAYDLQGKGQTIPDALINAGLMSAEEADGE
jgi:uncharacterized coiled-coil protein SlyX